MLDIFDPSASGRTTTETSTEKAAFFMNPGYVVEGEGVSTWLEVVSLGDLDGGKQGKMRR